MNIFRTVSTPFSMNIIFPFACHSCIAPITLITQFNNKNYNNNIISKSLTKSFSLDLTTIQSIYYIHIIQYTYNM